MRTATIHVIAVLLILAAPSAASAALTGAVIRSAYFAGGEGVVRCQPGEVATGGGPGVDGPWNSYVARSQPDPPTGIPTGWHGWLNNRADGSAAGGTVYAVCVPAIDATVRSAYFTGGEGIVRCQPGEVATGGGPGADGPWNSYVARSQPDPPTGTPTGWHGWLDNRADGSAASGTVYAVCARLPASASTPPQQPTGSPAPTAEPPDTVVRIQRKVVYFPADGLAVRHEWRAFRRYTQVQTLTVKRIPRRASLAVRCHGGGCPFPQRSLGFPEGARTTKLAKLFGHRRLRPGATIELRIAATGWVGKVVRFRIRPRRLPGVSVRCLRPGAAAPSRC